MTRRIRILRFTLPVLGILLLAWWPGSHWIYPVWYHRLLGFDNPGQYAETPLVRVIGTAGFFPILMLFFAAADPLRNRDMIRVLIAGGILSGLSNLYLIWSGAFPVNEYFNAVLYFVSAILLFVIYPWNQTQKESSHD